MSQGARLPPTTELQVHKAVCLFTSLPLLPESSPFEIAAKHTAHLQALQHQHELLRRYSPMPRAEATIPLR